MGSAVAVSYIGQIYFAMSIEKYSMLGSNNALWKVDLLEHKFLGYPVRYRKTSKLLGAKHNQKLMKKLPNSRAEAEKEILTIKADVFGKKYHGATSKLHSEVKKVIKADIKKFQKDGQKKDLVSFLENEQFLDDMVVSKVIKVIQQAILTTKEAREDKPHYLGEVRNIISDKDDKRNPSKFFKDHCQSNKDINNYVSNLWNNKGIKTTLGTIDWSFRLVRGNLTTEEVTKRKVETGRQVDEDSDSAESGSDSDSESDGDSDSDSDDEGEEEIQVENSKRVSEIKDLTEADFEKYAVYDNLVGDSEEEQPDLDPNINYNEVTDEEPSDEESGDDESEDSGEIDNEGVKLNKKQAKDDFFASDGDSSNEESSDEETIEKKYNLPELTTGYYSGGSDDEDNYQVDDDKVVKQATTQRKNRRGQRARQKIWEKKYGKNAKHKQKETQAYENDKKRRQAEFEERERKRQQRAKEAIENAPSGTNLTPLGERGSNAQKEVPKHEHPSWLARKAAEDKMKNAKFTGKKITFD